MLERLTVASSNDKWLHICIDLLYQLYPIPCSLRILHLRVEGERSTDLVGGLAGGGVVDSSGVEGKTEGSLDARSESLGVAEAEDTRVVDLGLDEGGVVKVSLGSDLDGDTVEGRLGVVDGLGTGLDVLGHLVVVAGAEGGEVAQTVEGHGVLRGGEANGSGVSGDGTGGAIVRGLGTDKEAVTADDGVGGEGGALEEVDGGSGVERGLLVDGSEDSRLLGLGRVEGRGQVKLETLGDEVVDLDLGSEEVGGGPGLMSAPSRRESATQRAMLVARPPLRRGNLERSERAKARRNTEQNDETECVPVHVGNVRVKPMAAPPSQGRPPPTQTTTAAVDGQGAMNSSTQDSPG